MTSNQPIAQTTLHPATHMGPVTLGVSDLLQSVDFYTNVLGMKTTSRDASKKRATVGVGSTPLLHLQEIQNARRQPQHSTGLYHAAILVPSRPDLGRVILNMARKQYPLSGASDHFVSEALYLDDPDGNGLEIYRDRPRDEWKWNGTQVVMGSAQLDIDGIVESAGDPNALFTGMADGTTIGHMHLRVGDIPKAEEFYVRLLGFDIVATWHSALFISAGGYHHHLGMNTWHSQGAPRPPADSVGLRQYTILVPDAEARDPIVTRLNGAGVASEQRDADVIVDDPWGNHIRLAVEKVDNS
jgi:catechol 2,3-dioxygenase